MLNLTEATQFKQELAKKSVRLDLGFILALRSAFEIVDQFTLDEKEVQNGNEKGEKEEDKVDEGAEQIPHREYP